MNTLTRQIIFSLAIPALGAIFSASALAQTTCFNESYNESQYGYNNPVCGNYKSEISPARAFADTVAKRGKWGTPSKQPVIIDVRSTPEYKAGHAEHSYNVPFPFIYRGCTERYVDGACKTATIPGTEILQNDADFVHYVESIVPNKETPIYTLCRTGHRSVGAAHVLADAGYTNVRNVWEGFVGVYLKAPQVVGYQPDDGDPNTPLVPIVQDAPVDLNHVGGLTDEDKNGWRNHQALPIDTRLLPPLIYQPMAYLYSLD